MTKRTVTTAAIILSIAGAGAPAAGALPDYYAPTSQHQPTSITAVSSRAPRGDTTDPLRSLTPQERNRVLAISALSDPELAAGFDINGPAATTTSPSHAVARAQAPENGFDWGDAGIGAGLALSVIGVGGALAVSQRRSRRTTALPS